VHKIELESFAKPHAELAHVGVHAVHPVHKRVDVPGKLWLADAMHHHPMAKLLGWEVSPAAGQDVNFHAFAHEVFGELSHVPCEATLDDRGILPGDQQHAHF
jgi:hypothetical protein